MYKKKFKIFILTHNQPPKIIPRIKNINEMYTSIFVPNVLPYHQALIGNKILLFINNYYYLQFFFIFFFKYKKKKKYNKIYKTNHTLNKLENKSIIK